MRGKLPTPCKSLYAANVLQSLKGDAVKDSETPSWLCSYALFQSKCLYLEVFLLGKHDSTFFLHCASILSTFPLLAFLLFPPLIYFASENLTPQAVYLHRLWLHQIFTKSLVFRSTLCWAPKGGSSSFFSFNCLFLQVKVRLLMKSQFFPILIEGTI